MLARLSGQGCPAPRSGQPGDPKTGISAPGGVQVSVDPRAQELVLMYWPMCWHSRVHLGIAMPHSSSVVSFTGAAQPGAPSSCPGPAGPLPGPGPLGCEPGTWPPAYPPFLPPALPATSRPCSDTAQPSCYREAEATKNSKGVPGRGSEQLVQCPRQSTLPHPCIVLSQVSAATPVSWRRKRAAPWDSPYSKRGWYQSSCPYGGLKRQYPPA